MGKAVKKVAKIAAVAAAVYFGGKALMASKAFASAGPISKYVSAVNIGKAGITSAGIGASLFGASAIQKVGLALQGVSYMQQRKFASAQASATKQAAEEQRRINEMQERVRLVQERRQRLDLVRQSRLQREQMTADVAGSGLGMAGTSGYLGATGAIQTQATANLASLNMASGASTAISRASQTAADYQSRANQMSAMGTQWEQVGSLGSKLYDKGPEIFDLTKSIFKTA
jgi:hypothetical protein